MKKRIAIVTLAVAALLFGTAGAANAELIWDRAPHSTTR